MEMKKVFKIIVIIIGACLAIGGIYFNYYLIKLDPINNKPLISFDNDMDYLEDLEKNSHTLCINLWPGVKDMQDECINEQYKAARELYGKYVFPYVVKKGIPLVKENEVFNDATDKEKEYLIQKCMEKSKITLPSNAVALDYVETLTCCRYSFKLYGFE